jgi:cell wall-associated NlpC family hydrolase
MLALTGAAAEPISHPTRAAAPAAPAATPSAAVVAAERRAARRHARQVGRRAAARRDRVKLARMTRRATSAARQQIGDPYSWGAAGPGAFDCSGLTRWALARAGVNLPRNSFSQAGTGRPVSRGRVRAGDLVFFSTAGPGASHVGIAVSRGTVVSATSSGVRTHAISDAYWGAHYVGARRVIRA